MKRNLFVILALALVTLANAQIKLTYKAHAFKIGDKHDFIIANNVNEGLSGANVTWDFSELVATDKSLTSYMIDPLTTEKGSVVTEANLALKEFGNIFYFKVSTNGMQQYGAYSGSSLVSYNQPFVKIKYPFTYGDYTSGNYSGSYQSGTSNIATNGKYIIEGDAYGTLILPNGVYNNTLRVKQTRTYNFENGGSTTEITYRWYTASVRYPVLVVIKYDNNGKTNVSQVAYYAHFSNENNKSIEETTAVDGLTGNGGSFEVTPNPFSQNINVNYTVVNSAKVSISLYDINGILISNLLSPVFKEAGNYNQNFNVSSNTINGIYYLKVAIGNNTSVKKIVKQ